MQSQSPDQFRLERVLSMGGVPMSMAAAGLNASSSPATIVATDHLGGTSTSPTIGNDQHHTLGSGLVTPNVLEGGNIAPQTLYNDPGMNQTQVFNPGIMHPGVFQPKVQPHSVIPAHLIHPSFFQNLSMSASSLASNYLDTSSVQTTAHAAQNGALVQFSLPLLPQTPSNSSGQATKPQKKEKIPRPPNAYILYRRDWHAHVQAKNPGINNNTICKHRVSKFSWVSG
jgi:hypothetical protein